MNDDSRDDRSIQSEIDEKIDAAMEELISEMAKHAHDSAQNAVQYGLLMGGMDGDSSLLRLYAACIEETLILGGTLSPLDRFFLINVTGVLGTDPGAALKVAQSLAPERPMSGAPNKRGRAYGLALHVFQAIEDQGAKSMEDAWAIVAEKIGVSESLVKQAWITWKPVILAVQDERTGQDTAKAIKERFLANKKNK